MPLGPLHYPEASPPSTCGRSLRTTACSPGGNPYLPRFEQWKARGLPDDVRQPVQHFATWHHLRRIRAKAAAGAATRGPVHSAKQEITETAKFLVWLHETYQRTAATCTQQDVDEWLATGPTTAAKFKAIGKHAQRDQNILRCREDGAPQQHRHDPAPISQGQSVAESGPAARLDP